MRHVWLTSHLLGDPAGAAAARRAAALGPSVHAELLAIGDRLAATSPLLAQRYYRQAGAAWIAFGADGFARWLALGEGLAAGEPPCREAAVAYFAVAPGDLGTDAMVTAAAWCALARAIARVSRRLAVIFLEQTAPLLAGARVLEHLPAWVETGIRLHEEGGWRGEFLAQTYFEAAAAALVRLGAADYPVWADVARRLAPTMRERDVFTTLPPPLAGWTAGERRDFLGTIRVLAAAAPAHAAVVYQTLPAAVTPLPPEPRAALLGLWARLDGGSAAAAADLAPVAGAVVLAVPAAARLDALREVDAVAAASPAAAVAALRVLPRLYEDAAPEQIRRWFAAGLAVARDSAAAGEAYFALESRTSLRILRAASTAASLDETRNVWRGLIHMLSGAPANVRGVEGVSLRPPLEDAPGEGGVVLPFRVDWLPTHEENWRVYRFLAAQLAGRREFGTYAFVPPTGESGGDEPSPGGALRAYLRAAPAPELLEDLFLLAEGVRVHHRVAAAYPGLARDAAWVARRLLDAWHGEPSPPRTVVLDGLLAWMAGGPAGRPPAWLAAETLAGPTRLLAALAAPTATVEDAMRVAEALAGTIALPRDTRADAEADLLLFDDLTGLEPVMLDAEDGDGLSDDVPRVPAGAGTESGEAEITLSPPAEDLPAGGRPLSLEELRRLIEAGARIEQATGDGEGGPGLSIADLAGKLPAGDLAALRRLLEGMEPGPARAARPAGRDTDSAAYYYDEWDHRIGDYRSRWCRLCEVSLEGDSGEFFNATLADYARFVPEIRRQFQRIRPEMYRVLRGLEDGEDFDLNAVVDARIDVRARRAPSPKLYRSRVREVRDVATLFLLDMSASTDEPVDTAVAGRPGRRIIDVTKEALVIMAEALEELGDAYAIYGFSGEGRAQVEVYPVKAFGERLGVTVKGRIGGLAPRRSTRMGTALRHAIVKMNAVSARAKHLILLSDGFPQDHDYGDDRRSHAYGIRDTAVALREADAVGITPFCITVDRTGHDYLRQMCDASRYVVIEDVGGLPRELPKIYQRVVRA